MNSNMSLVESVSAFLPEYVSTRHFKYSLRQGASRWPRVAFQINRRGASTRIPFRLSIAGALAVLLGKQIETQPHQLLIKHAEVRRIK